MPVLELVHPGDAPWLWRGLLASGLAGLSCAWLGLFLYLRGLSMLSDALAHVALPGVVLAWLATGRYDAGMLLIGAAAMGVVAVLGIEALARQPRVRPDASIGIVFTSLFALGIILLSTGARDAHLDVHSLLFGDLLGVSGRSLVLLGLAAPLTLIWMATCWRGLVVGGFDPLWARHVALPVGVVQGLGLVWTAVVGAASFEAVGVVLVIALFILPAATAHLVAVRMRGMVVAATASALIGAWGGFLLAVFLDWPPSGTVVLLQGVLYTVALVVRLRRGRGRRWTHSGVDEPHAQHLGRELPEGDLPASASR